MTRSVAASPPTYHRERGAGRAARRWTIGFEALTVIGAAAGVQGFLSGTFDPLVDQVRERLTFVDGPAIPALALGLVIGVPQAVALVLALRRHPRAAAAGVAAGVVLTGWVAAQLPMIGWGSPVQWVFAAIGLAEAAAGAMWLRRATPA